MKFDHIFQSDVVIHSPRIWAYVPIRSDHIYVHQAWSDMNIKSDHVFWKRSIICPDQISSYHTIYCHHVLTNSIICYAYPIKSDYTARIKSDHTCQSDLLIYLDEVWLHIPIQCHHIMSPNVNQLHAQILFGNMVRLRRHILIGIYIYIYIYVYI